MSTESLDPLISVVICTRNRPDDIALCLPTVLNCAYPSFEVILVDQSSDDRTEALVRGIKTGGVTLKYTHTKTVGKTRALNIALTMVCGDLIAFTDDDCEAPPGWLQAVADAFEEDPEIDMAFGPVVPSPALGDLSDKVVPWWDFDEARPVRELPEGMGANMAHRRGLLSKLPAGPVYDEWLGPGTAFPAAEEGDMSYRMRKSGARVVLRPAMRLYHRAYRTPDQWTRVMFGYGIGDGAFWLKHARCGDLWAIRMLIWELTRISAIEGIKWLLRRGHRLVYVRGYLQGLRMSSTMPVDKATRLYCGDSRRAGAASR